MNSTNKKKNRPPSARVGKARSQLEIAPKFRRDNSVEHTYSASEQTKENKYNPRSTASIRKQIVPIAITSIHNSTQNVNTHTAIPIDNEGGRSGGDPSSEYNENTKYRQHLVIAHQLMI